MSEGYPKTETLDKVYLPERLLTSDYERISKPDEFGRGVEFIRKEALLELAIAKHRELDPPQNEREFGQIEAVEEFIEKLQSL